MATLQLLTTQFAPARPAGVRAMAATRRPAPRPRKYQTDPFRSRARPSLAHARMTSPLAARHTSGGAGRLIASSVGFEAVERRDRAEGLLLGDDHVGRHIGKRGRLEGAAAPSSCLMGGALAAGD